jgi:hypothetical protein
MKNNQESARHCVGYSCQKSKVRFHGGNQSPSRTILRTRRALAERISEACAAAWMAVPPESLRLATRSVARVASARQTAIYFAHVVFEANLTRAGGIFGRDRTTARHACSRMEDLRDDPRIDRAFDVLETALLSWMETFAREQQAKEQRAGEQQAGEQHP